MLIKHVLSTMADSGASNAKTFQSSFGTNPCLVYGFYFSVEYTQRDYMPGIILHPNQDGKVLYLIGFFLEKKPCTVCSLVFLVTVFLICYSGIGNCIFWGSSCDNSDKG